MLLQKISPYFIALVIGLIIGVEREHQRNTSPQAMGVRSFFLVALLGAIAAGIEQPLVALSITLFTGMAIIFGYYRTSFAANVPKDEMGITTEIAAMATFGLGYFAHDEPLMSLMLCVIMMFALLNKTSIHQFIAKEIKSSEIEAAAILLLLAFGVIPLIPDRALDPWGIFNLHRLTMIISVIAGIQFFGYVASRLFGSRFGIPFAGFLGGIVSSTAVFISHAHMATERPKNYVTIGSAAMFSIVSTLCQLVVLVSVISWQLMIAVSIPVATIILVTTGIAFLMYRKGTIPTERQTRASPLNLWSAIKLGSLLMALILVMDLSQRFLGELSTKLVTFLAGLFELHGVVIAGANMLESKNITLQAAADTVLIAILASMISKIGITAFVGRAAYRIVMLLIICGLTLLVASSWILVRLVPGILITP